MSSNPVLVALDVSTAEEAVRLGRRLAPHVGGFKVGLGLLLGPGPATVAALAQLERPVFADAKLHDIPSQVRAGARRLAGYGARWISVHASGGLAMMEAAAEGAAEGGRAGLLGVTVLTSLDEAALARWVGGTTAGKLTSRLARLAAEAGCEGVVCSPRELGVVADVAPDLVRVTPGIRPAGTAAADQQRVAAPAEALARGADWLVVGRPIIAAPDPVAAAAALAEEIAPPVA